MPEPVVVETRTLHQGQNDRDRPWLLEEGQAQLIQNLDISRVGGRRRRFGVADWGGRSDAPNGLFALFDAAQNYPILYGVYGNQLYQLPALGQLSRRASGVSLVSSLHSAAIGRHGGRRAAYVWSAQVNDSNASLASRLMVITDQNSYTQIASLTPTCAAWFQNRIWAGNNTQSQTDDTLWWSQLNDGLSYSSFNTLIVEGGIGGRLTGLLPIRGLTPQLIIFKQGLIGVLEPKWGSNAFVPAAADALDTANSRFRILAPSFGCVATLSIQYVPGAPNGDIYFLAEDGVRALARAQDDTASGMNRPISAPIQTTIDRINQTFIRKAVSAVFDNKYHVAVPLDGATENSHVLSFDFITGAWYINTWTPKAFTVTTLNQNATHLWMQYNAQTADCSATGVTTAYHVFQNFSGNQDPGGVPVIYQEDSRAFTFDTLKHKKRWRWGSIGVLNEAADTCVIGIQYNLDNSGWVTLTTMVFGFATQSIILGVDPLPWEPGEASLRMGKFSLDDVDPGFFLSIRHLGHSDLSAPTIVHSAIAAEIIPPEFDNSIQ
jgi:hypothetical protein